MPVLSEQITVAQPSVSTAGSLRITAFSRANTRTPSASAAVTIAGKPSGIAATAKDTDNINVERTLSPLISPKIKITTQMMIAEIPSAFPIADNRF